MTKINLVMMRVHPDFYYLGEKYRLEQKMTHREFTEFISKQLATIEPTIKETIQNERKRQKGQYF